MHQNKNTLHMANIPCKSSHNRNGTQMQHTANSYVKSNNFLNCNPHSSYINAAVLKFSKF